MATELHSQYLNDRGNRHAEHPRYIYTGIFFGGILFSISNKAYPFQFSHPKAPAIQTMDFKCMMNYKPPANSVYFGRRAAYKRS